uniref:Fe2OG dioxygenase domain-containing protein n=1 Tax=Paramoeba aestuarina TaxID=180227 RepID=A0A7S4KHU5_9EUKA|mmetsp:Transcript_19541/g.30614  ORF Transcript_19541/g.30614 Transcript_19541/m.30614 type:complete len:597 (+) Transcript_19541:1-1791(+)
MENNNRSARCGELLRTGTEDDLKNYLLSLPEEERFLVVNQPFLLSSSSSSSSWLHPLHYVCVVGDEEKTSVLLEFGSDPKERSSDSFTALHYAAASGFGGCVQEILFNAVSPCFLDIELIEMETKDHCVYIGGIAVYLTGGQNIFHLASANSNVEFFEIFQQHFGKLQKIIESSPSPSSPVLQEKFEKFQKTVEILKEKKDFDGNTPIKVGVFGHCRSVFCYFETKNQNICDLSLEEIQKLKSESVRKRDQRFVENKKREEKKKREAIFTTFQPLNPLLFSLSHDAWVQTRRWRKKNGLKTEGDEGDKEAENVAEDQQAAEKLEKILFVPSILPLLHSIRSAYRSSLLPSAPPPPSTDWASLLSLSQTQHLTPGLFLFPLFFQPTTASRFVAELVNYESFSLPFVRPNSKIPYGMVLNSCYVFNDLLHFLQHEITLPLSWFFFSPSSPLHSALPSLSPPPKFWVPEKEKGEGCAGGAGGVSSLPSQYTFVKHYVFGKDTDPSTHFDPSVVTLNVCLGKEGFEGSKIYFHGLEGEREEGKSSPPSCPQRVPHPEECPDCVATITHKPGQLVLHRGKHVHGVYRLESGERWNMIMWVR